MMRVAVKTVHNIRKIVDYGPSTNNRNDSSGKFEPFPGRPTLGNACKSTIQQRVVTVQRLHPDLLCQPGLFQPYSTNPYQDELEIFASETEDDKRLGRWVVCAGWPYVNDRPHLGTLTQLLSADVYARYLRLRGEDVVLVSGSDEHGAPIEVEALKQGVPPKKLTSKNHQLIRKLLKQYEIRFDNYTRTESKVHKGYVQKFYKKLEDRHFVYSKTIALPYCESDQRFLPDRFVEGECPYCHAADARGDQCDNCGKILEPTDLVRPRCVLCGKTPILRETTHWFLDLPKLSTELRAYVETNPNFPDNARNFSLGWLKEGLKPRSLTRDISWGIPAPFKGATGKTLYVWMEAVLGYISATKEWAEKKNNPNSWKKFWLDAASRNVHFVGKDNIPFHTIILPGLLKASGDPYCLPWQVSSTEYIQFEGRKFSKSRGIGVWMDEALQLESAEYWRYALVSLRPELKDTNFTWEEFERKVNTELNDVIGNFINRTLSFLHTHYRGKVPKYDRRGSESTTILRSLAECPESISESFARFRLKEALEKIINLGRVGNRYLNEEEPWKTYKVDQIEAGQTLGIAVQIAGTIGVTLQPFLPGSSSRILRSILGKKAVGWDQAGHCFIKPGRKIAPLKPLFHKVSASELRTKLDKIRGGEVLETEA